MLRSLYTRSTSALKIDFIRQVKRFAKETCPDERAAHDRENVVRSFFIHNGARCGDPALRGAVRLTLIMCSSDREHGWGSSLRVSGNQYQLY